MNLRDLKLRVRALIAPREAERELDEELAFHLERETQKHVANGLDLTAARRRARARFGSVALAADACRDERRTGFIDTSVRDIRYALRAFRRAPLTAITIVFTVALGLGLVTASFTLYDAYILRADAVQAPRELFSVKRTFRPGAGGAWQPFTRPELEALRTNTSVLRDAFGMSEARTTRIDGLLMRGNLVTGNFFEVLGVRAALGRTLTSADDVGEGRRVLVLSHRGWKRLLAADPSAAGRTVRVNGLTYEVAGVMPEEFRGLRPRAPDYWAPHTLQGELGSTSPAKREPDIFLVIGRLKTGVGPHVATTALTTWAMQAGLRTMPGLQPQQQARYLTLEPSPGTVPREMFNTQMAGLLTATLLAFGVVLVIGCANVANLLLARGVARQREIGVRMALGAARGRIVRQLLTESLVLAVAAAVGGLIVSRLALAGALMMARAGAPGGVLDWLLSDPPPADWRVVLFLGAGAIVATASFGLLPALQGTRLALVVRTLRGEVANDRGPGRGRHALIAIQVGASALLLISAAVFLRGALTAAAVDHGVRTSDTLLVPITSERMRDVMAEEVKAQSFVADVAASTPRFGVQSSLITVETLANEAGARGARSVGSYQLVNPAYFDVLGIRAVEGRTFTASESGDTGIVVLSEWLARRLFPKGDAVGRGVRFRLEQGTASGGASAPPASDRAYTVIGVVRNPEWSFGGAFRSFGGVYVPVGPAGPAEELAVRVRGDPERARQALLDRLIRIDPALGDVVTLKTIFGVQEHLLLTGFRTSIVIGALALVLTLSGLFAVLSYLVARRTTEIGVRIALGATTRNVARLVLLQSLRAVAIGLIAGAALAGGVAKLLMSSGASSQIAELVDVYDPVAYGASLFVVVIACVLAASLPALRATRIDPGTILKQE